MVARGGTQYRRRRALIGSQVSSEGGYLEFYPGDFPVFSEPIYPHSENWTSPQHPKIGCDERASGRWNIRRYVGSMIAP